MTHPAGLKALAVSAATAATGAATSDHSIAIALITAGGGVAAVVIGPFVTDWARSRRRRPVDHHSELALEQASLTAHLLEEITERDALLAAKDVEIEKLRRRRRA